MVRGYTTIEQGEKLIKLGISPNSADMYYDDIIDMVTGELFIPNDGSTIKVGKGLSGSIAAWSLASLLELLPKRLEIEDNVYELSVYLYGLYYWNINNGNLCFESKGKDNLVDACYEMIIKLNELNLL